MLTRTKDACGRRWVLIERISYVTGYVLGLRKKAPSSQGNIREQIYLIILVIARPSKV